MTASVKRLKMLQKLAATQVSPLPQMDTLCPSVLRQWRSRCPVEALDGSAAKEPLPGSGTVTIDGRTLRGVVVALEIHVLGRYKIYNLQEGRHGKEYQSR